MPTYDYKCSNCGDTFEILQSIKAEPLKTCSKCGKETLQKQISGGAGLIFKGSGFYITDYKNKHTKSVKSSKSNGIPKKDKKEESKSKTQKVTKNIDSKSVSKTKKN
ncbi:FmdB family zinc ribbon protein [Bacteroidota bacterium]